MIENVLFTYGLGMVGPLVLLATLRWWTELRDLTHPLSEQDKGERKAGGRTSQWACGRDAACALLDEFVARLKTLSASEYAFALSGDRYREENFIIARRLNRPDWITGGKGLVASLREMVMNAMLAGATYTTAGVYFLMYVNGAERPAFVATDADWVLAAAVVLSFTVLLGIVVAGPLIPTMFLKLAEKAGGGE